MVSSDALEAASKAMISFTTFFCIGRLAIRTLLPKTRVFGDWFIYLAWGNFIALAACMMWDPNDPDTWNYLSEIEGQPYLVYSGLGLAISIFSATTLGLLRIGALLENRARYKESVWPYTESRWLGPYTLGLVALTGAWILAFVLVPIFQCGSDMSVWTGRNYDTDGQCFAFQILNGFVTSDLVLSLATIVPTIYTVVRTQKPLAVCIILGLVYIPAWASIGLNVGRLVVTRTQMFAVADTSTGRAFFSVDNLLKLLVLLEAGVALCGTNAPVVPLYMAARREGLRRETAQQRERDARSLARAARKAERKQAKKDKMEKKMQSKAGGKAEKEEVIVEKLIPGYSRTKSATLQDELTIEAVQNGNNGDQHADGRSSIQYRTLDPRVVGNIQH